MTDALALHQSEATKCATLERSRACKTKGAINSKLVTNHRKKNSTNRGPIPRMSPSGVQPGNKMRGGAAVSATRPRPDSSIVWRNHPEYVLQHAYTAAADQNAAQPTKTTTISVQRHDNDGNHSPTDPTVPLTKRNTPNHAQQLASRRTDQRQIALVLSPAISSIANKRAPPAVRNDGAAEKRINVERLGGAH